MADAHDEWQSEERRAFRRRQETFDATCRETDGDTVEAGRTQDVSLGGMQLVSGKPFEVGARVSVTLRDEGDFQTRIAGVVRRCRQGEDGYDVGIEFDQPVADSPEAMERLAGEKPVGTTQQVRRFVRVDTRVPFEWRRKWRPLWHSAETENLSAGGMMCYSDRPLAPGDALRVRLPVPDGEMTLNAEVVGVDEDDMPGRCGAHVAFLGLTPRMEETLGRFVSRLARGGLPPQARPEPVEALLCGVRRGVTVVGLALLAVVFAVLMGDWLPFESLRRSLYDLNMRIGGGTRPKSEIVLVAIDNDDLVYLARQGAGFPETERIDAKVLQNLKRWKASVVGFERPYFSQKVAEAVVQGDADARDLLVWGVNLGRPKSFRWGLLALEPDEDLFVRSAPLSIGRQPSFAAAVARARGERFRARGTGGGRRVLINYRGPAGGFPKVPYRHVAEGEIDPGLLRRHGADSPQALFRGAIVLVGATAERATDTYPTPFSVATRKPLSSLEVHANIIDNLLADDVLRPVPGWVHALVLVAAAVCVVIVFLSASTLVAVATFVGVIAVLLTAPVWLLSGRDIVMDPVTPTLAAVLGAGLAMTAGAVAAKRERQEAIAQRDALQREQDVQERSLMRARNIVEALLPDRDSMPFPERLDIAASFRPAERVGGDIYDVIALGPAQLAVTFADVAGHGISAALVAAMIKSASTFLSDYATQPGQFMTRLNKDLCRMLPDDMFVVVFYAVIDLDADTFYYASAGTSPLPLIHRADGRVQLLDDAGNLVASAVEDVDYEAAATPFTAGDTFIICSDGISEGRVLREDGGPLPDGVLADFRGEAVTAGDIAGRIVGWTRATPKRDAGEDDETLLVIRRVQ